MWIGGRSWRIGREGLASVSLKVCGAESLGLLADDPGSHGSQVLHVGGFDGVE